MTCLEIQVVGLESSLDELVERFWLGFGVGKSAEEAGASAGLAILEPLVENGAVFGREVSQNVVAAWS